MNRDYREFFSSRIKNVSVPSLQHATMVKVAIELWNQIDLREPIVTFEFDKDDCINWQEWRQVLDRALDKVAQLPLPELLKRDFTGVISLIGVEIKNWLVFNKKEIDISKLPNEFAWTAEGTIDKKKTAEMLVKNEVINVESRYKLACIYCLENEIPKLWKRISEEQKPCYYDNRNPMYYHVRAPVKFWTCHLLGRVLKLNETVILKPHVYAFCSEAYDGNVVATEFFFDKLSDEERGTLLANNAANVALKRLFARRTKDYSSEVFFFLLSKMSEDQLVQLLTNEPYCVLCCFLDWPYQNLFMDLAKLIMPLHSAISHNYAHVLLSIKDKMMNGWRDFDYGQLFLLFWKISPLTHKIQALKTGYMISFMISDIMVVGEKAIYESMLEDMDDKAKLSLPEGTLRLLILEERWDSVKYVLDMRDWTKEEMVELKDLFMRRYERVINMWRNDSEEIEDWYSKRFGTRDWSIDRKSDGPKWVAFFCFLDELIAKKNENKNGQITEFFLN